jgi:hypothetical protein
VNVVVDGAEVYASTKGEIFRLDPGSGAIMWRNTLPGLGWGLITVGTSANQQVVSLREKQRQNAGNLVGGVVRIWIADPYFAK